MGQNRLTIKKIAENSIIAAVYFIICLISAPLAFETIQFRFAELLVLLCFWRRDFTFGVTIGCLLSNILSPLGPWDMLFGTLLTLVPCLLVSLSPKMLIACLWPIALNCFGVALELHLILELPYWVNVGWVAIGEASVVIFSYAICMILWRNKTFMRILGASRRVEPNW